MERIASFTINHLNLMPLIDQEEMKGRSFRHLMEDQRTGSDAPVYDRASDGDQSEILCQWV